MKKYLFLLFAAAMILTACGNMADTDGDEPVSSIAETTSVSAVSSSADTTSESLTVSSKELESGLSYA
jgi:ABC-type enterochelin transport system substrate-binding protein